MTTKKIEGYNIKGDSNMDIDKLIADFLKDENRRAIYNEFSLQHELGIYFRKVMIILINL